MSIAWSATAVRRKSGFDLENIARNGVTRHPKEWQLVADVIHFEEMPPANQPQPSDAERERIVAWIEGRLAETSGTFALGPSIPRRLNRDEFGYTLYDLTGVKLDVKSLMPDENIINFDFDTIAEDLDFTAAHLENYMLVADLATIAF